MLRKRQKRDARDDIFKANDPNSDIDEHEHEHEGGSSDDAANSRIRLVDRQHKRRLRKRKAL